MDLLELREIWSQLKQLHLAPGGLAIIDCWRVGTKPCMDWIEVDGRMRYTGKDLGRLATRLESYLHPDNDSVLVMLCDLYAEENEPSSGVEWSHEYRVKGALVGTMSCLLMLMRNSVVRGALYEQPERLVVATIENGKIVVQEGQGAKMVAFLRDKT